jgi:hypothetical protein
MCRTRPMTVLPPALTYKEGHEQQRSTPPPPPPRRLLFTVSQCALFPCFSPSRPPWAGCLTTNLPPSVGPSGVPRCNAAHRPTDATSTSPERCRGITVPALVTPLGELPCWCCPMPFLLSRHTPDLLLVLKSPPEWHPSLPPAAGIGTPPTTSAPPLFYDRPPLMRVSARKVVGLTRCGHGELSISSSPNGHHPLILDHAKSRLRTEGRCRALCVLVACGG